MYFSLNCRLSLYADDSALFFFHKDPIVIADRLSVELSNCKNWFDPVQGTRVLHMSAQYPIKLF